MVSRIVNCHDALHAPVNSDPNCNRDMMESLRSNFLPVALTPHLCPDNSGSTVNRYADGNPSWGEVTKRYQQIIEKEYKLLNTCPLYYDGQTIPRNSPMSVMASSPSILKRDAIFKHHQYKESRKRNAITLKPDAEHVDTSDFIMIKERGLCSKDVREMEDTTFPKIVEVYSLNFPNIQAKEMENRKRKYQQGVSSSIEEKTFSPKKPSANIVIDLTTDEEEESAVCSSDDTNPNGKSLAETELVKLRESKNDKEIKFKLMKSNMSKRKRVLPRRKKTTTISKTMQKQRETNEIATSKNKHNSKESQQLEEPNGFDFQVNMSSTDGNEIFVHNQNNKVVTRKNAVNSEKNFVCPNSSNGDRSVLNMSYRDHKITDLKAKLAQQEEELAKLKALKWHEAVDKENPQTPLNDESVEKSRQKKNTMVELDSQKREDLDRGLVNIEDICQHVIKSFHVFNARVYKDNRIENEGCLQISTKWNGISCQVTANDYTGHGLGNKQDEFLFQVGLRRKSFT